MIPGRTCGTRGRLPNESRSSSQDGLGRSSRPTSSSERQFEIVGEALNKLRQADPKLADEIADLGRIVAFRNVLIHGYATVDDRLVWEIATERTERLIETLGRALGEA